VLILEKGADEEPAHRYQTIGENGEGSRARRQRKTTMATRSGQEPEQPGPKDPSQAFRRSFGDAINDFSGTLVRIDRHATLVVGRVAGIAVGWVLFTGGGDYKMLAPIFLSRCVLVGRADSE